MAIPKWRIIVVSDIAVPEDLSTAIKECLEIRKIVFQEEQCISYGADRDGFDFDARTYHFGARLKINPPSYVATGRLRIISADIVKIERMAVLNAFRRNGIGKALLSSMERYTSVKLKRKKIELNAQKPAREFYKDKEYFLVGEPYLEVGITHYPMRKVLAS